MTHYTYTAQVPAEGKYVERRCQFGQDEFTTGTYVRVTGGIAPVRYSIIPSGNPLDLLTTDTHATNDDLRAARAFLAYLSGE